MLPPLRKLCINNPFFFFFNLQQLCFDDASFIYRTIKKQKTTNLWPLSFLISTNLKAQKQIPDGLACGFVLNRGGEWGVCLVFEQEGQRRLCRVCSQTSRRFKATGFFFLPPPEFEKGRRLCHLHTCACPSAGTCLVLWGSISGVAVARDWVPPLGRAARTSGRKSGHTTPHWNRQLPI